MKVGALPAGKWGPLLGIVSLRSEFLHISQGDTEVEGSLAFHSFRGLVSENPESLLVGQEASPLF